MKEQLSRLWTFLAGESVGEGDAGTHIEWVPLAEWSSGQEIFVWVLLGLILMVSAWNLRRAESWPARISLFFLRVCIAGLLLFAFYQPALLEEKRARSTNTIIVLADDSASMALPQGAGTRRDQVASFVRDHSELWKSIEETNVIESYRFADGLEPTDWRDFDKSLVAQGQHTRFIEAFEQLRDRYRNRDVGGIVVLSDGIDNGRAGRILAGNNKLDDETRRLLESFEAPIYTFGLASSDVRDVSIHELRYSPFAFKRNASTIEAVIRVHGYDEGKVEVELLEEGRLIRSVTRDVVPGISTYTASFPFTPMELGHRVYAVRVKPFEGEVTLENNERHAVIRVNRDKIRVLQIAGHPSWDVRFLRNHLKRTPNIQLISFFILINPSGTFRPISPRDTALIPFPAEELFVEELGSFDLVVLQDFNYGPFATPQHLPRVRDYVKGGGALLVIGGRLALGAGDYAGTELEEVLPIVMGEPDAMDDALDNNEFRPVLTEAGRTHAITRLEFDDTENRQAWGRLPRLEGLNHIWGLRPDAVSLLDHPDLRTRRKEHMPVISVNEPEKGRSAVIATDSIWRYKMPVVGMGDDGRYYDRLVDNTVRWLIKDPELDLVRVTPSAGVRSLGDAVDLEVRVFNPDYKPAVDHAFRLRVQRRPRTADAAPEVVHESTGLRTDDNGRWIVTREEPAPGIYDVEVRSTVAGRQLVARSVFVVSDERPEMREVLGTPRLMQALAEVSGGSSWSLTDRGRPLRFSPPRVNDVTSRRYHERWNSPGVFLFACLLFSLEWWIRRRSGLL